MILRVLSFSVIMLTATHANGSTHVAPLSQYGQIQNVQNYSSNPFWNPNGPYNQTFPRPVYVDGPDLNSGDCERTVYALIASFCATNGNCVGMQLSDVRPSIMLQLSRLPGHNWATQCMGYIDSAFSEYQTTAQNHVPTTPVKFPTGGTVSNPGLNTSEFKIKNPFAPQVPEWAQEMQERKQELKELQSQTSNYDNSLSYSQYPVTYQNLSFAERMQIQQDGYAPYKGKSPYQILTLDNSKVAKAPVTSKIIPEKDSSVGTVEFGHLQTIQFDEGDAAVTETAVLDCYDSIKNLIAEYFSANPWGVVNGDVCTGSVVATDNLRNGITSFIQSNSGCSKSNFTKNGFLNYIHGTLFYAKINVYYETESDKYSVSRVDVKTCCNSNVDSDCLLLSA